MIVVTGATGHIGNVLIRELITRRQIVRALVMPNDDYRPLTGLEVEIVRGDVTDPKSLESAFGGPIFKLIESKIYHHSTNIEKI